MVAAIWYVKAVKVVPLALVALVITGGAEDGTVNVTPLLATPFTVTTTLPVEAPAGTGTDMLVAPQLVGVAAVPLKVTVLVDWLVPKPVPVTTTGVPTAPEDGDSAVIAGELAVLNVQFRISCVAVNWPVPAVKPT